MNIMKKTILLVDDIKEFRALLKVILSGIYEVVTAEDGEEALELMKKGLSPDVIVTDLIMPRMDGYQLISKVKCSDPHKKIPIIVLSNVSKAQKRDQLKKIGVDEYLNKPFDTTELREGLGRSLNSALNGIN